MTMIKHCVDYRTLQGKRDLLGLQLSDRDRELLEELDQFFSERALGPTDVPEFARRDYRRRAVRLAVEFRSPDGSREGRMADLSGGGTFIETAAPLATGAETVVRVFDRLAGREWRFGAEVAWVDARGMGLRFVGIPLEVRLGHRNRPKSPVRRAA